MGLLLFMVINIPEVMFYNAVNYSFVIMMSGTEDSLKATFIIVVIIFSFSLLFISIS